MLRTDVARRLQGLRMQLASTARFISDHDPPTFREVVRVATIQIVAAGALLGPHIVRGSFSTDDWKLAAMFKYYGGASHPFEVIHAFLLAAQGRPILAFYVPATFTAFGTNPHLHLAWLAILAALVSVALFTILRTLGLSVFDCLVISLVVLAFPYSDSTKFWVAGSQPQVAIALYLAGTLLALRAFQQTGRRSLMLHVFSVALYALSIMTYEATFGLVLVSFGLYAVKRRSRAVLYRALVDAAVVAIILLTVSARTAKSIHGFGDQLHHVKIIFLQALDLFAVVLFPWGPTANRTVVLIIILAIFASGLLALFVGSTDATTRRRLQVGVMLIGGGLVGVAAAYLPYVPADDYYSPYGAESLNRVNASATIGYVVLAYGLVRTAGIVIFGSTPLSTLFAFATTTVIAAGCVTQFVSDEWLWDRAAAKERTVMNVISRLAPSPKPRTTIYLWGSRTTLTSQLPIFNSTWDLSSAMQLRYHDFTINAFPILPTTGFQCGATYMYPTNGLYGEATGSTYARGVFIDFVGRRAISIKNQQACQRVVDRLSTPTLTVRSREARVEEGDVFRIDARLTRGDDPIIAAPVGIQFGKGAAMQTCAAITLPSGVAVCEFGVPTDMVGSQPISAAFAGDAVLRRNSASGVIHVEVPGPG